MDRLWRDNGLHAAHHYTRDGINYRLGVMKEEILGSNILKTPLGQHMIHHYTRDGINYRLGVMKEEILGSNILKTPLGQHMIQTVVRFVPRACSCY